MATKFQIKRSTVSGVVPTTFDIAPGELAVNLADKKLFTANTTSAFELGSNLTNLSVTGNLSVTAIIANGSLGTAGQTLTSNGSSVYWSTSTSGGGFTNGQSISVNNFVITGAFAANNANGVAGQVLFSNGSGVYWADPAAAVSEVVMQQFTANGTSNSFTIAGGYIPNAIEVYLNGVKQLSNSEVVVTSGSTVNFISTPGNNYIVDVFGYRSTGNIVSDYLLRSGGIVTGNITFNSNALIIANGTFGTTGQVLTSNGSVMYWSSAGFSNGQSITVNNLVVNAALTANGSNGSAGYVLHSSGSGVYWDVDNEGITSLTGGNGLSGGNITVSGTLAVLGNTGIVANSSGVFVDSAYINSISSNSSSYLGNSAGTLSNITSWITSNSDAAYSNAVAYSDGKQYVNTSQLSSNLSNYAQLTGAVFTGDVTTNNLTVSGNLTLLGNTVIVGANNLIVNDAVISLHSPANGAALTSNDGRNIGIAFHYFDTQDEHGALLRDNSTGRLTWYSQATDPNSSNNVTGETLGTIQAAQFYAGNNTVYSIINSSSSSFTGNVSITNLALTGAVTANGSVGSNGQILVSNSSGGLYWGDKSYSEVISEQFTANGTANSFTVTGGYIPNAIEVYVSGVKQIPGTDVIVTSGTTVNLITPPLNGQIVDVFGYKAATGVTTSGTVVSVSAGNGLSGGPITTAGTLSALANTGIVSNSSGLFVNSSYITSIAGVTANSGIVSNNSGVFVNANNGVIANSTGVFVNANTGLVTNSAGVFVNTSYIATTGKAIAMAIVFGG